LRHADELSHAVLEKVSSELIKTDIKTTIPSKRLHILNGHLHALPRLRSRVVRIFISCGVSGIYLFQQNAISIIYIFWTSYPSGN